MKLRRVLLSAISLALLCSPLLLNKNKSESSVITNNVSRSRTPTSYVFRKVTSSLDDNRGRYLIVSEANNKAFNSSVAINASNHCLDVTISDGVITDTTGDLLAAAVQIVKAEVSNTYKYFVKLATGSYLYYNGINTFNTSSTPKTFAKLYQEAGFPIKVPAEDKPDTAGNSFCYKNGTFAFYSSTYNSNKVYLYKYDSTGDSTVQSTVESYVSLMNTFKSSCDSNGVTMVSQQAWDTAHENVSTYSVDVLGYLGNVTYTHNEEAAGSLKDVIDLYDYVVSKYSDVYTDYLQRKDNPNFHNYSFAIQIGTTNNTNSDNTLLVILSISLVTLSVVSFFILKRYRKEQ